MTAFTLPTTPQTIAENKPTPMAARIYLMGTPKVGKTTMASRWAPETTCFLDLQHGTDLLPGAHYVSHIENWTEFEQACEQLAAGQHPFQTVVIDTVDMAYKLADAHAGARRGQVAAGLVEYGKGTAEAEGLFRRAISSLLSVRGLGIWFIGHADLVDVDKGQQYVPALDKRVQLYIRGECEHMFIAEKIGNRTVLHTQASPRYQAGSRLPLPEPLDMDARVLYAAMQAGINQLSGTTETTNGKATK